MTAPDEDQDDKPYEASQRKLEDARKKGQIVRSQDTVALGAVSLLLGSFSYFFGAPAFGIVEGVRGMLSDFIQRRVDLSSPQILGALTPWVLEIVVVFFVVPFFMITAGLIAARQMVFTQDNLKPKLSRLSLLANAKKKFGASGLFEFFKSVAKAMVLSTVLWSIVTSEMNASFQSIVILPKALVFGEIFASFVTWLAIIVGIYVCFSAIDIVWQIKAHAKKQRMSHKELKDEHKNEEGDAQVKQQRRNKAEEIATNRMLLDVPKASVVITNPTHYAVALSWTGGKDSVPKCVARGTDETARKIREVAIQSGVPLYRDPPTARALYAKLKIGMSIDHDHYKAVAIAIRYARRIQKMVEDDART